MWCRGLHPPFKGARHNPKCPRTRLVPEYEARQLKLYDAADDSYLSKPCRMWQMDLDDLSACFEVLRAAGLKVERPTSWPELHRIRFRANKVRQSQRGRVGGLPAERKPRGPDRVIHGAKRLVHGWRLSHTEVGVCGVCGELTFGRQGRPVTRHPRCDPRQRAALAVKAGRKRSTTAARDFDWAVRHLFGGERLEDLDPYTARNTAWMAVQSVLARVPNPLKVAEPYRKYVVALLTIRDGEPPTPITPPVGPWASEHGTVGGYNAHIRRGEKACDACSDAHNGYMRDWRRRRRAGQARGA
jgi:hypothetical protein